MLIWLSYSFQNLHNDADNQEEMEEDGEESAPAEDLFSEIHLGQLKKV